MKKIFCLGAELISQSENGTKAWDKETSKIYRIIVVRWRPYQGTHFGGLILTLTFLL